MNTNPELQTKTQKLAAGMPLVLMALWIANVGFFLYFFVKMGLH